MSRRTTFCVLAQANWVLGRGLALLWGAGPVADAVAVLIDVVLAHFAVAFDPMEEEELAGVC